MEFLDQDRFESVSLAGIELTHLLSPRNSTSTRVQITAVTVAPGVSQSRHAHDASEQIWVALEGAGMLLLDGEHTRPFAKGQVVRFEDGDVHGFLNTGAVPFVYLAITAPPVRPAKPAAG